MSRANDHDNVVSFKRAKQSRSLAAEARSEMDWNEPLKRVEQIIEILRPEGYLDEEQAAAALKYLRYRVQGGENEDEDYAPIAFLLDHGQSLDWVFANDPSSLILKLAKHAQTKCEQMQDDPIFAAIECHREACRVYRRASANSCRLAERSEVQMAEDICEGAISLEGEALKRLLKCRPTTLEGVGALLEHLGQPEFLIDSNNGTGDTVLSGAFEYVDKDLFPHNLATAMRAILATA